MINDQDVFKRLVFGFKKGQKIAFSMSLNLLRFELPNVLRILFKKAYTNNDFKKNLTLTFSIYFSQKYYKNIYL